MARDGIGAVKEDKCFGMKGLGQISPKAGNIFNVTQRYIMLHVIEKRRRGNG